MTVRQTLSVTALGYRIPIGDDLGHRGIGVVAVYVERLDQPGKSRVAEPVAERVPGREYFLDRFRLTARIDIAAQAHLVNAAIQADEMERLETRILGELGIADPYTEITETTG